MRIRNPAVYILASKRRGTLYVGSTSDLPGRIWQHRNKVVAGFTLKYSVHRLVYYEMHQTMPDAIARELLLKRWRRSWKIELIEMKNPQWRDLYEEIV